MKNLQRTGDNSFSWKLNASSLLKNLDKIMEGIERQTIITQQITGFPVIFLKGGRFGLYTYRVISKISFMFFPPLK